MFNEDILLKMGTLSIAVWAFMDKTIKPTLSRILDGFMEKKTEEERKEYKAYAYQVGALVISLFVVMGAPDLRFANVVSFIPVGQLWEAFDIIVTAILITLGDEAMHLAIDLLRLVYYSKEQRVLADIAQAKGAPHA